MGFDAASIQDLQKPNPVDSSGRAGDADDQRFLQFIAHVFPRNIKRWHASAIQNRHSTGSGALS
jgi:hypothetical protein